MIIISNTLFIRGLPSYERLIEKVINDVAKAIKTIYTEMALKKKAFQELTFDINLILTEALTNAFYHGNNGDISKPISLSYKCDGKTLNFKIIDSGDEDKKISIPDEIKDEDLLNEGGRGLFLIKALADKVEFNNNTLIIDKYIAIG